MDRLALLLEQRALRLRTAEQVPAVRIKQPVPGPLQVQQLAAQDQLAQLDPVLPIQAAVQQAALAARTQVLMRDPAK